MNEVMNVTPITLFTDLILPLLVKISKETSLFT